MIAPGEPVPDVTVLGEPGEVIALRELAADGPVLFVFYILDWTGV